MELTLKELTEHSVAAINGFASVESVTLLMYPYFNITDNSVSMTSAFRARVSNPDGTDVHTVLLAYMPVGGIDTFFLACGDKMSDGVLTSGEAMKRCGIALTGDESFRVLGKPSAALQELFDNTYDKFSVSDACDFWRICVKGQICSHTNAFLHHLKTNLPNFVGELKTAFESSLVKEEPVAPKGATWSVSELLFRVPVLIEGDRGSGKTVEGRTLARSLKCSYIECPGHEGVEAPDLLGYLVPYGIGQMVWKDGPLAEAFRKAVKGPTVLMLDELLRIPQRELSILLTAFSPDEGAYRLRTGRIVSVEDGVGTEEVLECPIENLGVIATTNVGAEYAVDEMDPALAERFAIIRKDTQRSVLEHILALMASKKKLSSSLVGKAMVFYDAMLKLKAGGLMRNTPTTRTMVRPFELAEEDSDVQRGFLSQSLVWVARSSDGRAIPAQVKSIEDALTKSFK